MTRTLEFANAARLGPAARNWDLLAMSLSRRGAFRPFCTTASPPAAAFAAFVLVTPLAANAQGAPLAPAQAVIAPCQNSPARLSVSIGNAAAEGSSQVQSFKPSGAAQNGNAARNKTSTPNATDELKQAAKSASDILSRAPCLPPKDDVDPLGTLPHVAAKLRAGQPRVVVAFGSSSTQGFGATSPECTYPSQLAWQLRRHFPTADITVVNAGRGGEIASDMIKRLQSSVLDRRPDLVIWQVGTNAVLRNLDFDMLAKRVQAGVTRIQAAGSDLVLVGQQYSPRITEHPHRASKIVKLLGKPARLHRVGRYPRFNVMRAWHEKQNLPIDAFVISDGLHMNDWGYACFAQLLGGAIIRSVGQIKTDDNVRTPVQIHRPM